MIRISLSIFLIASVFQITGQSIGRQTIGCTGKIGDANSGLTATVGPSILNTAENNDVTLTQGFQQPELEMIMVETTILNPDCYDINGGQVDLEITGCGETYDIVWSNGDSTSVAENLSPGTYTYTINSGACNFSGTATVELELDCGEEIPNLVTPNGDGTNDFLEIPQFHLEANQVNSVSIYNRWGQKVWEAENYDNTEVLWSGTNANGEPVPAGTYYYLVSTETRELTGFIELMR